jgi:hypothetical protein
MLIDQSGSMDDPWGAGAGKKANGVAEIVNKTLRTFTLICRRGADIKPYFEVGVIGYGENTAGPIFGGALAGRVIVPILDIARAARVEERTGSEGEKIKSPVWVDPVAHGMTPMCKALALAEQELSGWIAAHPGSFPPMIMNVTDGEASDGDPTAPAEALKALHTDDGPALVMNCHISSLAAQSVMFPNSVEAMPDQPAKTLYAMSSVMPDEMIKMAQDAGVDAVPPPGSRAFGFNAGLEGISRFFNVLVGTVRSGTAAKPG